MDSLLTEPSNFLADLKFSHGSISIPPTKNLVNGFKRRGGFSNPVNDPSPPSSTSSEVESPEDSDSSTSNSILKFISEILMEEDLEEKPCMLQDCLALQAAEKSFYDVLNQEYVPSFDCRQPVSDQIADNPTLSSPQESSSDSSNTNSCSCSVNGSIGAIQAPESGNLVAPCVHLTDSLISTFRLLDSYSSSDGFGKNIFVDRSMTFGSAREAISKGGQNSVSGSKGKKSHGREEGDFPQEGRSNKQSAVFVEEPEQLELFDEVLLCQPGRNEQKCPLFDD
ncbi:hypothetical protein CRG98_030916, partial [Punica granatum]